MHNGVRPRGHIHSILEIEGKPACQAVLDTEGRGSCAVSYHSSVVSGIETVAAAVDGFPRAATTKVKVAIRNLMELAEVPSQYVLVGTPSNHAGTNDPCRVAPPTSKHFQNHFGEQHLLDAIKAVAKTMKDETGILLRINDISLPFGGLFDFKNDWRPPHKSHRIGKAVDIGVSGVRGGRCTPYTREQLKQLEFEIRQAMGIKPKREGDHIHATVP